MYLLMSGGFIVGNAVAAVDGIWPDGSTPRGGVFTTLRAGDAFGGRIIGWLIARRLRIVEVSGRGAGACPVAGCCCCGGGAGWVGRAGAAGLAGSVVAIEFSERR